MEPAATDPETAILMLLGRRAASSTICPSEAARATDPDGWREAMPAVHDAAHALHARGVVVLTQGGIVRAPADIVGAYRIRRA